VIKIKFICCISSDGYMAKGPNDTMSWTPKIDKKIFQLISGLDNGICFTSKKTKENMPKILKGRTLIEISRNSLLLGQAAELSPNGLILGGPILLKAAYEAFLIDDLIVNQINFLKPFKEVDEIYKFPFKIIEDIKPSMSIDFGEVTTYIYRLKRYNSEDL